MKIVHFLAQQINLMLGLDEVDGGDVIGWDICYMIEEMDCYWLDFDNHKTTLEDGLECIIIDTMALSKFE